MPDPGERTLRQTAPSGRLLLAAVGGRHGLEDLERFGDCGSRLPTGRPSLLQRARRLRRFPLEWAAAR